MLNKFSLLAMTLPLSACVSLKAPPSTLPDFVVPAAWSEAASVTGRDAGNGSTLVGQWWRRFNDSLLDTLIAQALQSNTSIRSAQAALRRARALRDVAAAGLLPIVSGTGSVQRNKSGGASASNAFNAGIDASWEIDFFGVNRSALQAGEADAQASAASLADAQVSIAAEVAVSYIQLRGAQARLAIARDNLASQLETLQLTDWRVQAGLLTSLEGEQARHASEQARSQIPTLVTSVKQWRHSLAVLCGQTPDALPSQLASVGPVPQAQDDLALSMPAEALRQRPDVRAAEHRVSAAQAQVAQSSAARLPSFKLSGSLGLNALSLGSLTSGGALVSALLASVSGPLFDGGSGQAQVRAQQAALDQARESYRATVLTAIKEVEDALVALGGNRERLLRLRNATGAAANAALIARQRYASGLVDFQVVLETQRTLLGTRDALATTIADLGTDHVRLYKALGGGWQPDRDSAVSSGNPASAAILTAPVNL